MKTICRGAIALVGVGLLGAIVVGPSACLGQSFRVETDVFRGDSQKPISQTLTVFQDGMVYDFPLQPKSDRMTVFDRARGVIVLLDASRKMKAVVTTKQLLEITAQMKVRVDASPEYSVRYAPRFQEQLDSANNQIVLTSPQLEYRAKFVHPQDPNAVIQYQQFADWFARLNAMHLGHPPFARIELDARLAVLQAIPSEVVRTITGAGQGGSVVCRARHMVDWQLSPVDYNRIKKATAQRSELTSVGIAEFWHLENLAQN